MARELSAIVNELEAAMNDVQAKGKTLAESQKAMNDAAKAHRESQDVAAGLKLELNDVFNHFIPTDAQGRVRQS